MRRLIETNRTLWAQLVQAQKMENMGMLTGGIAHDFNNLLTMIHGYAEVALMKTRDDSSLKEPIHQILHATQRAALLTQQLLDFSRGGRGEFKPQSLNDIIQGMTGMLRRIIGENIEIDLQLGSGLPAVFLNQAKIEQILINLAVNARDAMDDGGELAIRTWFHEADETGGDTPRVYVSVRDSGSGMDERVLRRIFDPFFTTKEQGRGTGLGLSVVRDIIDEHNGCIETESKPGMGTTFLIGFPSSQMKAEEGEGLRLPGETLRGDGEGVLLVEDEANLRRYLGEQLRQYGYRTEVSSSLESAASLFEGSADFIDVLVSDVVLPDGSGVDLAEKLVDLKGDLKVLLISGYDGRSRGAENLKGRGIFFMKKPFSLYTLLENIWTLLHNS
jgi:CheY-like chemotaxis protein/two-component sensor histidine kinase